MDGTDVKIYENCLQKARELNIKTTALDGKIQMTFSDSGTTLGCVRTIYELFSFLCGYEWGIAKRTKLNELD